MTEFPGTTPPNVVTESVLARVRPKITERNAHFWQGGADGMLRLLRCQDCGTYLHPPAPVCRSCRSMHVAPEALSGRGVVYAHTINHYQWLPDMAPPYVVAIVELVEQPGLQLMTNIVGCAPTEVHTGMEVEVVFAQQRRLRAAVSTGDRRVNEHFEDRVAISGIGRSQIGRRLQRDPWALTAEAALAAIADAGLRPDDIDGISTYPGGNHPSAGFSGAGLWDVRTMLGLDPRWMSGGPEVAGQIGSIINAAVAVGSGVVDHVLCFRSVWESTSQMAGGRAAAVLGQRAAADASAARVEGDREWTLPYGVGHPNHGALLTQRYFYEHGGTREQLAEIALNARRNAARNPDAVYRDPLTLDDYLGARMISEPLCLYDCDVPVDGAIAAIVSRREAIPDTSHPPILVEAIGSRAGMEQAGEMLWSRSPRLTPRDVDIAEVYDGWSILSLLWLEALNLCGRGEAARFVEGGGRIALDGDLPISTGGGQLSAGRLHGYLQVYEACLQLRGEGGERQVSPQPEVAVASTGANHFTGCLLLAI